MKASRTDVGEDISGIGVDMQRRAVGIARWVAVVYGVGMPDWLPMVVGVGGGVIVKQIITESWARYKARYRANGVPLKQKNGIWVPDNHIERMERIGTWALFIIIAVHIAFGIWVVRDMTNRMEAKPIIVPLSRSINTPHPPTEAEPLPDRSSDY